MHRLFKKLGIFLVVLSLQTGTAISQEPENLLYLTLEYGEVVIQLRPDLAPKQVAGIKELARQGFYDGIVFHRVIEGFMAQTGDPTGTGRGGSGKNLDAEFSPEPFVRGTLGMARSRSPNSADSQFFINFAPASHLNGQYTVRGQVIEGMEHVDKLKRGSPPRTPDNTIRIRVCPDLQT